MILPAPAARVLLAFALVAFAAVANAQEDILIDRERPDRTPPRAVPRNPPRTEDRIVTPRGAFPHFVLRDVRVENSSLAQAEIDAAVAPLRGETVAPGSLRRIPESIAAAYAESDIALYSVLVPEQDFTAGIVRVTVIEGHVSHVAIHGDVDGDIDLARHYAAAFTAERPLRRATMERGMLLLSDIPGLKTGVTIAPAADPGGVDLGLGLERKRFQYTLDIDDYGVNSLGRVQLTASLIANGLFRLGDESRLVLGANSEFDRYFYAALAHRQPIGHDGAALQARFSALETRPDGGVRGRAHAAGLVATYPAIRSYRRNLTLSFGADGLNSDSALLGDRIASERTRVLRAAASYSDALPRRFTALAATLSRGLDGFGARANDPSTTLDFTKANLQATYARNIGEAWALRLAAGGQMTADPLPASERFALGGQAFGRAFAAAELAGDSGLGASAELAWLARNGARDNQRLSISEIYGFLDGGRVWNEDRAPFIALSRDLASTGLGMRIRLSANASLSLEAAQSLDEPVEGAELREPRFGFALSGQF